MNIENGRQFSIDTISKWSSVTNKQTNKLATRTKHFPYTSHSPLKVIAIRFCLFRVYAHAVAFVVGNIFVIIIGLSRSFIIIYGGVLRSCHIELAPNPLNEFNVRDTFFANEIICRSITLGCYRHRRCAQTHTHWIATLKFHFRFFFLFSLFICLHSPTSFVGVWYAEWCCYTFFIPNTRIYGRWIICRLLPKWFIHLIKTRWAYFK